jgi:Ni/Fe-hydrogenase subunit HybB-like protein
MTRFDGETVESLSFEQVNQDVLAPLQRPRAIYFAAVLLLGALASWGLVNWLYQVKVGMGVAGINQPVGWASYITNFVFWVGIAHSGTLISAILFLVRAKWRTSVSRSAEAMTLIAILTAGMFPLIHLGRLWVFYYILPYPSERQLWPNFQSPLVWDVCAVGTYFTVSLIFFYVGLIPDLASARDRFMQRYGPDHFRTKLYRKLAIGWSGSSRQWQHHGRSYLYFAALATPLVVSVHSVVSWDFAMGLLPGWHVTLFAPYFVAGAIHSGLAMVLTLLIPMRKWLHLERLIRPEHFEAVALTMLVTTSIVGYAYIIEPFMSWYSNDVFEQQFAWWRATGPIGWLFWALVPLNVLIPLTFVFKKLRTSIPWLFAVSIFVNIGMWLERLVIIAGSTWHDFLPHNWGWYFPTIVEVFIFIGAIGFFLFSFCVFARIFPTIAMDDVKRDMLEGRVTAPHATVKYVGSGTASAGVLAIFSDPQQLISAVERLRDTIFTKFEVYSPTRLHALEQLTGRHFSPVRFWTLIGALIGVISGFGLAIGSALVEKLIVGGKHPIEIVPYCIVGFEGLILSGSIFNLIGMLIHSRLGIARLPAYYHPRFSSDRFGVFVSCTPEEAQAVSVVLSAAQPEEIHVC